MKTVLCVRSTTGQQLPSEYMCILSWGTIYFTQLFTDSLKSQPLLGFLLVFLGFASPRILPLLENHSLISEGRANSPTIKSGSKRDSKAAFWGNDLLKCKKWRTYIYELANAKQAKTFTTISYIWTCEFVFDSEPNERLRRLVSLLLLGVSVIYTDFQSFLFLMLPFYQLENE